MTTTTTVPAPRHLLLGAVLLLLLVPAFAGAASYPEQPFVTTANANLQMTAANLMPADMGVCLTATLTLPADEPAVWFLIGMASRNYSYFTHNYTPAATVTDEVYGMVLIPGKQYWVCVASPAGYSNELNFTMPAARPLPTTTFSAVWDEMFYSNRSITSLTNPLALPYVLLFGTTATEWAWSIFWLIVGGILCLIMWIRQEKGLIVAEVFIMCGSLVAFRFIPEEFKVLGMAFGIVIITGTFYYLFRKG